jgi:Tol biopolymer transport system component
VPSRLISGPADDKDPVWSPDGREIVFSSDVRGDQDLLRKGVQANEPPGPPPRGIEQTARERDISKEWVREEITPL